MTEAMVVRCANCGREVARSGKFCSECGGRIASDDLPTFSSPARPPRSPGPASPAPSAPRSSGGGAGQGRFIPGTVLAGRYRIVALLGRGGMGEVYRADDLTLDQPVALKFLPEAASDADRLERFRQEVKIARKVSHPNVCRVYDISERTGVHFLSMEYVDGEDLATLLRRIGRLPADKALEVARKVCAGLAAAHDKGVLHRDLKPANVMLDGRGNVMITDFGLAALAEQIAAGDVRSGTPAYMAPEQLEGREVTPRSDIYSLGLVLYEIFTGKKAFEGKTLAEAMRTRSGVAPREPVRAGARPGSRDRARDHALPRARRGSASGLGVCGGGRAPGRRSPGRGAGRGGDALAAGRGRCRRDDRAQPASGARGLAVVVAGLLLALTLGIRLSRIDKVGLAPPEVLSAKAREILGRLGYAAAPRTAPMASRTLPTSISISRSRPGGRTGTASSRAVLRS